MARRIRGSSHGRVVGRSQSLHDRVTMLFLEGDLK